MRAASVTLALLVAFLAPAGEREDTPEAKELKALGGTWSLEAVWYGTECIPKKLLAGRTVTIRGTTYTQLAEDGAKEAEWKVKLDVGKKPRCVSMTLPGKEAPARTGIYELKGDTLKVALVTVKGKRARPSELKPGAGVTFVTLKRVNATK